MCQSNKLWLGMGIFGLLLTGCTTLLNQKSHHIESLAQLEAMYTPRGRPKPAKSQELRIEALQEIGLSIGAQAGLAARAQEINQARIRSSQTLDHIFNFNLLLLPHNVVPPVLIQAENTLNLADSQTLRIADRTYQIIRQAHFVSIPPIWRDYLWLNYSRPEKPVAAFLPKTTEERIIWRRAVKEGWKNGVSQANAIDTANLARLKRDYIGMVLYRKLLRQGMVSKPYVAHTDLGVTGDHDNLRIHDQVLRITASPALQVLPQHWKPVITSDEETRTVTS